MKQQKPEGSSVEVSFFPFAWLAEACQPLLGLPGPEEDCAKMGFECVDLCPGTCKGPSSQEPVLFPRDLQRALFSRTSLVPRDLQRALFSSFD